MEQGFKAEALRLACQGLGVYTSIGAAVFLARQVTKATVSSFRPKSQVK
jgi:hypothetical protein